MVPKPVFTRKAIYSLWAANHSKQWKTHVDEVELAMNLLRSEEVDLALIPLNPKPGFRSIAFALPTILQQWNDKIREISLDSACDYLFYLELIII